MIGKIPHDFPFPDYDPKTRADVLHTCIKMNNYFRDHDSIAISVSGGSDSDCIVHLVCTYFPEYLEKCKFVFVNTGLEYDATKRHLCDLEKRYGITIDRIRGQSVVTACRKFGFPILNKAKAKSINQYLRGTPKGEYLVFRADGAMYSFKQSERELARYLKENGIMVSSKCCDISKKEPLYKYMGENSTDLNVSGERKAEGGKERQRTNHALQRVFTVLTSICLCGGGRMKQSGFSKKQRVSAIRTATKYGA